MNNFWQTVIKPIISATNPEVIVEIGVLSGENTRNILNFCTHDVQLHSIDPAPSEDGDEWLNEAQDRLVFHREPSLTAIPKLPEFQLGLIDGDHNWYTVYHELQLISKLHGNNGRRFPVLIFHDVAWPYGRRDLYYDPDRIPAEFRQDFARKGICWGKNELAADGGINRQLMNAVKEGGPKNGVLTAIEDFLKGSPIKFDFVRIPAYFGLGILVSRERKADLPDLATFLDELIGPGGLMKIIELLEEIRAKADIRQQQLVFELKQMRSQQTTESDQKLRRQMLGPAADTSQPTHDLSIVTVVYNMRREAERTLHSLTREYQRRTDDLNYEVIVVDNGSDEPLGEEFVSKFGENFSYHYLENAPPSPARAINIGAERARGQVLAIMIDGAHVLTPGILHYAMSAFKVYPNPIVAPRYWFTGPGQQGETVQQGYGPETENKLFERISWPSDGYRLFEIGEFITPNVGWMSGFFESNCLFMRRPVFEAIGGANERFNYPGGGFLNLDLMREATEQNGVTLVTLLGEATFHQVHGGITTNVPPELRERRVEIYRNQYREIRGREYRVPAPPLEYLGHRPNLELEGLAFKSK